MPVRSTAVAAAAGAQYRGRSNRRQHWARESRGHSQVSVGRLRNLRTSPGREARPPRIGSAKGGEREQETIGRGNDRPRRSGSGPFGTRPSASQSTRPLLQPRIELIPHAAADSAARPVVVEDVRGKIAQTCARDAVGRAERPSRARKRGPTTTCREDNGHEPIARASVAGKMNGEDYAPASGRTVRARDDACRGEPIVSRTKVPRSAIAPRSRWPRAPDVAVSTRGGGKEDATGTTAPAQRAARSDTVAPPRLMRTSHSTPIQFLDRRDPRRGPSVSG